MSSTPIDINDLQYELRALLGASLIWDLFKAESLGNPTNYMMDAAFVHTRNLYNFFTNNTTYDGSLADFGYPLLNSNLYTNWREPLHRHALHINNGRSRPTNMVGSQHINQMVQLFAADITNLWQQWIAQSTSNAALNSQLVDALADAQKQANDDFSSVKAKLSSQ